MPTLPIRFISSRGPVNSYVDADFLFCESVRDYATALSRREDLRQPLQSLLRTHELVIYRMSRFDNEFRVWRQRSSPMGDERKDGEPSNVVPFGYSIYAVPQGLTSADPNTPDNPMLSQRVVAICSEFGQHGNPSGGGP